MVKSKKFIWHETGWGKITITVVGGLILFIIIPNPIASKIIKVDKSNNQVNKNSDNNIQIPNNKGNINIIQSKQAEEQVEIFADAKEYELKLANGNIQKSWNIVLWNAGKLNLNLNSYIYESNKYNFKGDGLLPAGSDKFAQYIIVPDLGKEKTELIVYFTDCTERKYSKTFTIEKVNGIPQIYPLKRVLES